MAFMEKENTIVKMYTQWLDKAANIHLEDESKQVCHLEQTCTPTGAAQVARYAIRDTLGNLLNTSIRQYFYPRASIRSSLLGALRS